MLPAEILAFFPHDRVRVGQDQLLLDVQRACAEKKILIAHAPTGLGKTASALAIAAKEALEKNKKGCCSAAPIPSEAHEDGRR